jgi:hypothetical protein
VTSGVATGPGPANVRPRYGQASLSDLMPAVLASLGVPGASDPLGLATDALADVRVVVVLLLDGLGYRQLPLAAPHAPGIAELAAGPHSRSLTTGFPSTTPTSLASLGTGAAPGAHGLVGFFLNIPGTDRILNHIQWTDDPDPLRWQPLSTQFRAATDAGIAAHVVLNPDFRGTGLTVSAFRGSEYRAASNVDTAAAEILSLVRAASGPTVIYGYAGEVDTAGHAYGLGTPQWTRAVANVDRLVTMIRDGLPPGAALLVTADHGQINVPTDRRFDLDADPRLRTGIRLVAGESRVRYLHTVGGATADVVDAWRGVLGDAAWVVTRDEAVAAGWFGPVAEAHLQRIGDVVAACHDDYAVLAGASDPPAVTKMVAFHGSATEPEMLIPLLVGRG